MKKEDFCELLGDVNESHVANARAPKPAKRSGWVKWGAMAACLAVIAAVGIPFLHSTSGLVEAPPSGDIPQSGGDLQVSQPVGNRLVINEVISQMSADMDVKFSSYDDLSPAERATVLAEFQAAIGVSYDDLTARIPDRFTLTFFYSVDTPDGPSQPGYSPHDYVLCYETAGGGSVAIALCSREEPLRDCIVVSTDPEESLINGVPVIIHGHESWYMTRFSDGMVNYDIEAANITPEELEELLSGILADPAAVSQ